MAALHAIFNLILQWLHGLPTSNNPRNPRNPRNSTPNDQTDDFAVYSDDESVPDSEDFMSSAQRMLNQHRSRQQERNLRYRSRWTLTE